MRDEEKIARLKTILGTALEWYRKSLEEHGRDYVYDMAYEQFSDLRRGDCEEILSILN